MMTKTPPPDDGVARQAGLAAIAAAECLAGGDQAGMAACSPSDVRELWAQRNALVMVLADAIVDGDIALVVSDARTGLALGPEVTA